VEKTFISRIKHYASFKIIDLNPPSYSKSLSIDEIRKKEAKLITPYLEKNTINILLDEIGKNYTSVQFSEFLNSKMNQSKDINLIIGGAYGFSNETRSKAHALLALSKMTMPHHLARVVLLEQVYRAFTILKNEKYHNS